MKKKHSLADLKVTSFTTRTRRNLIGAGADDSWTGDCCKTYLNCETQLLEA